VALSCKRGFGTGTDQNGARFSFTFGMSEKEALDYIAQATAEVAGKPEFPVYKPKEVRKERGFATGTGFFVGSHGELITNFHVVEDATAVTVHWKDQDYQATTLKLDPANDLALLQIGAVTPALRVSSAREVAKAQDVMTLGYPLITLTGQEQKASFGHVNALSGIQGDIRFLQIDVPVQPGNSGGPLLGRDGTVIGVVTATLNQLVALRESGSLPQNINYAVKSDYVLPLLPSPAKSDPTATQRDFVEIVRNAEGSVVLVIAK
jgi:S1-C subfamily serine protease